MAKTASPKTLLGRRLKDSDFPIIIRRKRWIEWMTVILLPVLLAFAAMLMWLLLQSDFQAGWGALFLGLFAALLLLGCYVGLDNIGFELTVDTDGLYLDGRLKTRHIDWDEITGFGTWRGRAFVEGAVISLGFYQAVIHVDGSNNPKRLLRNLFFAGHFVPPMMELGGKELIRLLAKAGKHLGRDVRGLN